MVSKRINTLSAADIRSLVYYDPKAGTFTWKQDRGRLAKAGEAAGMIRSSGYRQIKFGGKNYQAARVAWIYMTGEWPSEEIDHINGDPSDDRFSNLRPATRQQNCCNRVFTKTQSGVHGVRRHRNGTYDVRIAYDGKTYYLGTFATLADAIGARGDAQRRLYGSFSRD